MGEANLRFVRGEIDTAIRMCMEVIRQEPGNYRQTHNYDQREENGPLKVDTILVFQVFLSLSKHCRRCTRSLASTTEHSSSP